MSCPNCAERTFPGEDFCEACGQPLTAGSVILEVPPEAAVCIGCGGTGFSDGYCDTCGTAAPEGRDHVEIDAVAAGAVSDRGLRRARNEDAAALAVAEGFVIAVVSDGVSVSPRPDEASQIAVDAGAAVLAEQLEAGADPAAATRTAVEGAAKAVAELASSVDDAPACTYVSAVVHSGGVTIGWVGDSRGYWLGDDATVLTADDSWAARVVALGLMTEDQAQADARAHTITGWLGADAGEIKPNVETFVPSGPGLVLICSDGLWNHVPAAIELAAAVDPAAPPIESARELVRIALGRGGHDNVTVAVIPFPPPEPSTREATQ